MTSFIKLDGVTSPSDRPKVDGNHPLLPENGGALFLVEPGAPGTLGWSAGVPAQNAAIKNLAQSQALAMIPGSSEASLLMQFERGSFNDSNGVSRGLVERTAKGGLHTVFRPADETVSTDLGQLYSSIKTPFQSVTGSFAHYLNNNKEHSYYWSVWVTTTRRPLPVPGYDGMLNALSFTAPSGNYIISMNPAQNLGADLGSIVSVGAAEGVPARNVAGTNNMNGTPPTPTLNRVDLFTAGHYNNGLNSYSGGGTAPGRKPSRIFYLAYAEDLTVSGRTYAQVEALDAAAHAAAFGPGGRYYNDTYTNPNTWTPPSL